MPEGKEELSVEVLVSEPQELLLSRRSYPGIAETTLVVPDLPVDALPYARFLIDTGPNFQEHAVALCSNKFSSLDRSIVQKALTLARPTLVSFLFEQEERAVCAGLMPAGGAACAVAFAVRRGAPLPTVVALSCESEGKAARFQSFSLQRLGRFFVCKVV